VVVTEDHRGRIGPEHGPNDFARVHRGAVDCPAEKIFRANEAMAIVEEQEAEDLVG